MRAPCLALLLIAAVLALPPAQADHEYATIFEDDFEGGALDTTKWVPRVRGGSIVVSGGAVTLSTPASGFWHFPDITTVQSPGPVFAADVPFRVTLDHEYTHRGFSGNGLSLGPNIQMWAASTYGGGPATEYRIGGCTYLDNSPLARHVAVWEWDGATGRLWLDGVLRVECALSSVPATDLQFGNPCCHANDWSTFRLHDLKVEVRDQHGAAQPLPELATLTLVAVGLVGAVLVARRR